MNDHQNEKQVKALLKQALAPVKSLELQRDLWPQVLRRLDAEPLRIPWFDWALAALLLAALLIFPGTIPALLYQL
jgi:hypothetical protein